MDNTGARLTLDDDELDARRPLEVKPERRAVADPVAVRRDRHDGARPSGRRAAGAGVDQPERQRQAILTRRAARSDHGRQGDEHGRCLHLVQKRTSAVGLRHPPPGMD